MKKPVFVLIGEDRFRINTIKRYTRNGHKIKIWFNVSRYKIDYMEIEEADEIYAAATINMLDDLLL